MLLEKKNTPKRVEFQGFFEEKKGWLHGVVDLPCSGAISLCFIKNVPVR